MTRLAFLLIFSRFFIVTSEVYCSSDGSGAQACAPEAATDTSALDTSALLQRAVGVEQLYSDGSGGGTTQHDGRMTVKRMTDGKKDDGMKDDGKKDDGKKVDGKKDDGMTDDGKKDDAMKDDGERDDGKFELLGQPGTLKGDAETKILHIGKTAGSSLIGSLAAYTIPAKVWMLDHGQSRSFMQERKTGATSAPPYKDIVFFVRAPVHRFTSGWIGRFRKGPGGGIPWTAAEKVAFKAFSTPDDLACNLSSADPDVAAKAKMAMSAITHLKLDIAWYLGGLSGVEKSASQILFVGTQEHYSEDFKRLLSLLEARNSFKKGWGTPKETLYNVVHDADKALKKLGRCSVLNLHKWYSEDYQIIRSLASHGLLNKSYVDEIARLDAAPAEGRFSSY